MHQGHRARLKNRFLKEGLANFAPHEVLELMLFYAIPQKDVNPLAHELLAKFTSLDGVFSADISSLQSIKGIGKQTATYLKMFPSVLQYYQLNQLGEKPCLSNRSLLHNFCKSLLSQSKTELLYMLSLDKNMRLINVSPLSKGDSDTLTFTFRDILQVALASGAHAAVLCHNHPSGNLKPSDEDISSTKEISFVLEKINVSLVDHIIVAGDKTFSILRP